MLTENLQVTVALAFQLIHPHYMPLYLLTYMDIKTRELFAINGGVIVHIGYEGSRYGQRLHPVLQPSFRCWTQIRPSSWLSESQQSPANTVLQPGRIVVPAIRP